MPRNTGLHDLSDLLAIIGSATSSIASSLSSSFGTAANHDVEERPLQGWSSPGPHLPHPPPSPTFKATILQDVLSESSAKASSSAERSHSTTLETDDRYQVEIPFISNFCLHLIEHGQESQHEHMVLGEDQVQNMEVIEKFTASQKSFLVRAENKLESDSADYQELRRNIALQKESLKLAEKCLTYMEEKQKNQEDDVRAQQEACSAVSMAVAEAKASARATEVRVYLFVFSFL
jgi:hypothetical protein